MIVPCVLQLPASPLLRATLHVADKLISLKHHFPRSVLYSRASGGHLFPSTGLEFRTFINEVPIYLCNFISEPAQETHHSSPQTWDSTSVFLFKPFPLTERLFHLSPNPHKVSGTVSPPVEILPLHPTPQCCFPHLHPKGYAHSFGPMGFFAFVTSYLLTCWEPCLQFFISESPALCFAHNMRLVTTD